MFTEEQLKQLGEVMEQKLAPLERRMDTVQDEVRSLRGETQAGFERLAHDIGGLVNAIGAYIDKRLRPLEKRVERLEEHVGLPKPQ